MIRRNVASQGPYKFPQLINLSGAFVASGASVEVTKDGTKAAATNAPTHDTNGRWLWSPTAAETDCVTMIAELIGADGSSVVLNFVTTGADTSAVAFGANTTTPPTASAVATQTRTELTTELARIDVATSTRLASASYTSPPSASTTATAVRSELATELARVDATVSSRSTLTAANVWDHATRSLTTFGTLVSDIWSAGTRTLTAISDSSGITTLLTRIIGTLASGTHQPQGGDAWARLGEPAGASIAADIAAIEGGGGGSTSVTVVPLTGVVESRVNGTTIKLFVGETPTVAIAVRDAQGEVVDVSELSLQIVVERTSLLDVSVIANSSITKTGSTISFAVPSGLTTTEGSYIWSLRTTVDSAVLMQGPFVVTYAARVDA